VRLPYRLEGELAAAGDPARAEACFRRALEVARDQQAVSWERKVLASMSRYSVKA
jgi:hypothetical protein